MLTPFDRKQQAAERRAAQARRELDEHTITGELVPSTDWDDALAKLTAAPTIPPSVAHKPAHGGYPS